MRKIFGRIRNALLETLYPEGALCAVCGKISDGEYLCPACRAELRESGLLESWETESLDGVQAWSIRPHSGAARSLVLSLKHGAEARAAEELTALLRSRPEAFPAFPPETVYKGQESYSYLGEALDKLYTKLWLQVKVS